jgi:hypothetical protein
MLGKNLVLYLDEDEDQRILLTPRLAHAFGNGVEVKPIQPERTIELMISEFNKERNRLRALVLDEQLYETGVADYTGSSLAKAFRELDSVIPIFILTSHTDESHLQEKYSDYDHVLDKEDFTTDIDEKIVVHVRRQIGRFDNYVTERSSRMHELLERSILNKLSEDESKELCELTVWRNESTHLSEHYGQSQLKRKLDEKQKVLDNIIAKIDVKQN